MIGGKCIEQPVCKIIKFYSANFDRVTNISISNTSEQIGILVKNKQSSEKIIKKISNSVSLNQVEK